MIAYEDCAYMAHELIQEAKGAEGPNGGFVTDHLDAAEGWLDKMEQTHRELQAANKALMAERDMWRAQALTR